MSFVSVSVYFEGHSFNSSDLKACTDVSCDDNQTIIRNHLLKQFKYTVLLGLFKHAVHVHINSAGNAGVHINGKFSINNEIKHRHAQGLFKIFPSF